MKSNRIPYHDTALVNEYRSDSESLLIDGTFVKVAQSIKISAVACSLASLRASLTSDFP